MAAVPRPKTIAPIMARISEGFTELLLSSPRTAYGRPC
jgi:hypothetical protein